MPASHPHHGTGRPPRTRPSRWRMTRPQSTRVPEPNMNAHEIIPVMDDLREAVDSMEIIVGRKHWPVPTYNEILFYA